MKYENQKSGWEHFHHESDIGVRGFGATKESAFEQAALAMTAVITDLDKVEAKEEIEVSCEAQDDELLLAKWLNALIYEMATRDMLFSDFEVNIEDDRLRALVRGEKVDVEKHQPTVEVKAATYLDLKVYRNEDGVWVGQCVVDV